jgi:hypothetical protein
MDASAAPANPDSLGIWIKCAATASGSFLAFFGFFKKLTEKFVSREEMKLAIEESATKTRHSVKNELNEHILRIELKQDGIATSLARIEGRLGIPPEPHLR